MESDEQQWSLVVRIAGLALVLVSEFSPLY